jgi:hypothetical protein
MIRIFHNKKVDRMVWIGLIVIIGPAFTLWGVNYYQSGNKNRKDAQAPAEGEYFGTIFGRRVTRQEYVDALKAAQLQLRMQFGESFEEIQKLIDLKAVTMQRRGPPWRPRGPGRRRPR